jgi:hypothetical protein
MAPLRSGPGDPPLQPSQKTSPKTARLTGVRRPVGAWNRSTGTPVRLAEWRNISKFSDTVPLRWTTGAARRRVARRGSRGTLNEGERSLRANLGQKAKLRRRKEPGSLRPW